MAVEGGLDFNLGLPSYSLSVDAIAKDPVQENHMDNWLLSRFVVGTNMHCILVIGGK